MAKRFIALLFLPALAPLLIGVSYAADKIALNCSGTGKSNVGAKTAEWQVPHKSFLVDLDRMTVTMTPESIVFGRPGSGKAATIRDFSITKVTESEIEFRDSPEQKIEEYDRNLITTRGGIDRISGHAYVNASQGMDVLLFYDLTCKRTNPLF